MANIRLQGVVKRYPKFTIGPIDLEIPDNEFFGIFGPPSCGKTSILKIILGLVKPDEGKVYVNGRDVTDLSPEQRNMAMVFQNLALFPHLNGAQNISFPLVERGFSKEQIEQELDRVSRVLHIAHILYKVPAQMSGGERQRIALGRAFVRQPDAFLLDEPIAALDARLREEMRVELKRLQSEGNHTFIYVSHDEEEVMSVADRLAIVVDGKVLQVGTPDEIYDSPSDVRVATQIGAPPMNLIAGAVSEAGVFEATNFEFSLPLNLLTDRPHAVTALGIRPENLEILQHPESGTFEAIVVAVEPLGGHTIVDMHAGRHTIKIRIEGQLSYEEGVRMFVRPDIQRLHFFSEDS